MFPSLSVLTELLPVFLPAMPACSFGFPNTQIMFPNVIHKSSACIPVLPLQAGSWLNASRPTHAMMPHRSNKASTVYCALSSLVTENEPVLTRSKKEEGEKSLPGPVSQLTPNSTEVMSLLSEICDTTSIAEFELKLDGFYLHVTRALSGVIETPPPPPVPSVSTSTSSDTASKEPAQNDQLSTTSLAITKTRPSEIKSRPLLERAADEGLVIIQSPKVGFFRRCRTIKGKRVPPACKEKQIVKEGQVVCYIEQLGWEAPIESDIAGEVLKFLCEDGEPVGFGDPIIAILPSFPGIKKLPAEN